MLVRAAPGVWAYEVPLPVRAEKYVLEPPRPGTADGVEGVEGAGLHPFAADGVPGVGVALAVGVAGARAVEAELV